MPLERGTRLGPYQIESPIGAGGMGEVADLLRQHGISRTTFFKWRSKYAGASVADVKRLRELEGENAKLKQMYADLALENAAIKDVLARKL